MSRFFSSDYSSLVPYTPGEQPQIQNLIKLNTNESPFPPSPKAQAYAKAAAENVQLYSDPTARPLHAAIAKTIGVSPDEVLATNGSDEILNFAFMAFCDKMHPAAFADLTYGFYPVFAQLNDIPYTEIPLAEDFTIRKSDYLGIGKTIFIANPNAPTGILLPKKDVEEIIASNPDNVVVVDEAYVDFGGESCVDLIHKYENLLVTQTYSKSRSMAGARLGFGVGCAALITDLNTIKYSTNPYNINAMTMAAGIGAMEDEAYTRENCETIIKNRTWTMKEMQKLGFYVTDSKTNFLFAKHNRISGLDIYTKLRAKNILVRHLSPERIRDFNRITIGSMEQMQALICALGEIVREAEA
ncbi:MAG: histidinol-phosphate transaminase [Clostridia bacterium]|nr:histidinol-phosphate transaminase [Clostridia bacterium]